MPRNKVYLVMADIYKSWASDMKIVYATLSPTKAKRFAKNYIMENQLEPGDSGYKKGYVTKKRVNKFVNDLVNEVSNEVGTQNYHTIDEFPGSNFWIEVYELDKEPKERYKPEWPYDEWFVYDDKE